MTYVTAEAGEDEKCAARMPGFSKEETRTTRGEGGGGGGRRSGEGAREKYKVQKRGLDLAARWPRRGGDRRSPPGGGGGDQNSQTAEVSRPPVGSGALIRAVMDAGDNALSSIPVRSIGPNNAVARPVIHCTPIYSFLLLQPVGPRIATVLFDAGNILNKCRFVIKRRKNRIPPGERRHGGGKAGRWVIPFRTSASRNSPFMSSRSDTYFQFGERVWDRFFQKTGLSQACSKICKLKKLNLCSWTPSKKKRKNKKR